VTGKWIEDVMGTAETRVWLGMRMVVGSVSYWA